MLPGHTQTRTGIPVRVTARPTTTCGRSGPVVLGVAEAAQGLGLSLASLLGLVLLLDLEVGRGGVEEEQVDLEVEQVGDREEDGLLHGSGGVGCGEHVHRPVGRIGVDRLQARDRRVTGGPLGCLKLRRRSDRPVTDQGEQHPLDVVAVAAAAEGRLHRAVDAEPPPERLEREGRPHRARVGDPQLSSRRLLERPDPVGALQVAADRAHQATEAVDVQLVLAAQLEQHLEDDAADPGSVFPATPAVQATAPSCMSACRAMVYVRFRCSCMS